MKISFSGVSGNQEFITQSAGYGRVANQLFYALKRAGVDVEIGSSEADINFCVETPLGLHRVEGQYNIGFSTHESTLLPSFGADGLRRMDEIWTMSKWIQSCFELYVDKQVTVIPTCISSSFIPTRRSVGDSFVFLHIGEPNARKNGQMVLDAFVQKFANSSEVSLIIKTYGIHRIHGANHYSNVHFINETYSEEQYIKLLNISNCLVYPSTGCGGGMMPQEAMATGMPVVAVSDWMDYHDYIHLPIESTLGPVPNYIFSTATHLVGQVYNPKIESVVEQMERVYTNYPYYEKLYFDQAEKIKSEYDWDRVAKDIAIPRFEQILSQ